MSQFRPLSDHELDQLADDALIGYVRAARDAGEPGHAQRGLQILVYGHWDNVVRRVRMKVPEADVEDVAGEVIVSAVRSAFDGESVGEFKVWLKTITSRRIADYHRSGEGEPAVVSLQGAADDDPGVDPPAPSHEGYVEVQDAISRVLARLSEIHRAVVELSVFGALSAAQVVARVEGMTEANVHQIVSRFRRALREELGDDGDTSGRS